MQYLDEKALKFYKIMWYPIPIQKEFFVFNKKLEIEESYNFKEFARNEKNENIKPLIEKINKFWRLYKSLPFVSEIFICNSLTFNAVNPDSDIDIFIIAKKNNIRKARFFSVVFFTLLWLKRTISNKSKKFCLSFYITQDNKNLYSIILDKTDIYLAYRLAHLVPIYQENLDTNSMYISNPRFSSYLPNHPKKYCINLWNGIFTWKSKLKKIIEFIFWWIIWKILEKIIKMIRIPILKNKTKKLWEKWKWIIINDKMLKFYDDKREFISDIFNWKQ